MVACLTDYSSLLVINASRVCWVLVGLTVGVVGVLRTVWRPPPSEHEAFMFGKYWAFWGNA